MMQTLLGQIERDLPRAVRDYGLAASRLAVGDEICAGSCCLFATAKCCGRSLEGFSSRGHWRRHVSPASYALAMRWGDRAKNTGTPEQMLVRVALDHNRAVRISARKIIRTLAPNEHADVAVQLKAMRENRRKDRREAREIIRSADELVVTIKGVANESR